MATVKTTSSDYTVSVGPYIGNEWTGTMTVDGNLAITGITTTGVYTSTAINLITGTVGQIVAVSDSPTSAGRLAFWDTTNSRWSYVSDNSAV